MPGRLDLLTACGLADGLFHHSLEGRERAEMVLGHFAETKVSRRAEAKPRIKLMKGKPGKEDLLALSGAHLFG